MERYRRSCEKHKISISFFNFQIDNQKHNETNHGIKYNKKNSSLFYTQRQHNKDNEKTKITFCQE